MVKTFKTIALAGALMMAATPVFADDILAPLMAPMAGIDLDPFHILTPAPAAAPAPAPMMKKHHMKKHMMKKHMKKKM